VELANSFFPGREATSYEAAVEKGQRWIAALAVSNTALNPALGAALAMSDMVLREEQMPAAGTVRNED